MQLIAARLRGDTCGRSVQCSRLIDPDGADERQRERRDSERMMAERGTDCAMCVCVGDGKYKSGGCIVLLGRTGGRRPPG